MEPKTENEVSETTVPTKQIHFYLFYLSELFLILNARKYEVNKE